MNGWTAERKARQAELIGTWQPWKHSTGAKTTEGKAITARNAFKGGLMQNIKLLSKQMNSLIREQKQLLKDM